MPSGRLLIGSLVALAALLMILPLGFTNGQTLGYGTTVIGVRITVDNSGPAASGIVVGCLASPTTIAFDGAVHYFDVNPNCVVTIYPTPSASFTRYRFGNLDSLRVLSCAGGVCQTVNKTAFFQLYNRYAVVAKGQPNFDANLRFRIVGMVGGAAGRTVCNIITRVTDSTASCLGWADFAASVTFPSKPFNQRAGTMWLTNNATLFSDTTGNKTHTVTYDKQVPLRVAFQVAKPLGVGYTPPVFNFKSFAHPITYSVTTKTAVQWADYGSAWSISGLLPGSGGSERWVTLTSSGTASAAATIRPIYYHQYFETFQYSVSGGGNPPGPTVTYRQSVSFLTHPMTTPAFSDWANAGTKAEYPRLLTGSNSTTRWAALTISFSTAPFAQFTPTYDLQYFTTFAYTTSDSSQIAFGANMGSYLLYGSQRPVISTGGGLFTPLSSWVDAGTSSVSFATSTDPRGGQRWALSNTIDVIAVHSSRTVSETGYFHQFGLDMSYSLVGGGAPAAPTLACNMFGSSSTSALRNTPGVFWCDISSSWSVTPIATGGSSLTERWQTQVVNNGVVTGPQTIAFPFYHQFLMAFSRTIVGGGSPLNPTVTYFQFGLSQQTSATSSPAAVWTDASSSYVYTNPTSDSTLSERWSASLIPTAAISSSTTVNPLYYHQVAMSFGYTTNDGSSTGLSVSIVQFGSPSSTMASRSTGYVFTGTPAWVDVGTTYAYDNPSTGSTPTNRWFSASTTSGTVSAPATMLPAYFHQVMVAFKFAVSDGSTPTNSPNVAYVQNGNVLSVAATPSGASVWADGGSTYTYDNPTPGTPAGQRWMAPATPTGTITSSTAPIPAYFHQFSVNIGYTTSDISTLPTGTGLAFYTQFGNPLSLTTTPAYATLSKSSDWADASSSISFASPLSVSATERDQIAPTDAGTDLVVASVSGSTTTASPTYYHQFKVSFAFTTSDGTNIITGTNVATYIQFAATQTLTSTGTYGQLSKPSDWANSGTQVSYYSPIMLSSLEREKISSTDSGTNVVIGSVSGLTLSANPLFFHQYDLTLSYSSKDSSVPSSAPFFTANAFGVSTPTTLTTLTQAVWYDGSFSPTAYSASDPIPSSPSTERWMINTAVQADKGAITTALTISFLYYHQFFDTFEYTIPTGYTTAFPPNVTYMNFGSTLPTAAATGPSSTAWVDAGTTITYPSTVTDGTNTWTTSTTTFTATSSTTYNPSYT